MSGLHINDGLGTDTFLYQNPDGSFGVRFDVFGRRRNGTQAAAPTVASGAGAGTSPTVTVVAGSTDEFGTLSVAAGSSTAAGILGTITFANAYKTAPNVVLTAQDVNSAAAGLYATTTATTLVIKATSAVTASQTTKINWHAVGGN